MIIIHDMLKVAEITPATISDDELAAVIAALAIYTEPKPMAQNKKGKTSGWKKAALLEGAGKPRIDTLDKLVTLSVAIVIGLCSAMPAWSQEMPPLAPEISKPVPIEQQKRVRVALVLDSIQTDISLPDGAVVRDATTGDTIAELPAQSQWQITSNAPGGFARICFDGKLLNAATSETKLALSDSSFKPVAYYNNTAPRAFDLRSLPPSAQPRFFLPSQQKSYVLVPAAQDGTFAVGGKLFRGTLLIQAHNGSKTNGIDLVNHVELEDYLFSVVPSEMPSRWPLEALKAQAIAARSYAVANLGKHAADGYDIKATIDDQAYAGVSAEHTESTQAVLETRGQVLQYDGKVISAYFHSASGGFTELAENVWSKPVPYLRAVADYDDDSPNFSWTRNFTVDAAEQAILKSGKNIGQLLSLTPVARGVSPRVHWLMASGTDRTVFISGEEARRIFALPSTAFNIGGTDGSYVFAGRGYGHGLGMSQWGAKKLAEAGWTAPDILSYYYKDVTVNQF
jgi:stage II sporulation protein D